MYWALLAPAQSSRKKQQRPFEVKTVRDEFHEHIYIYIYNDAFIYIYGIFVVVQKGGHDSGHIYIYILFLFVFVVSYARNRTQGDDRGPPQHIF